MDFTYWSQSSLAALRRALCNASSSCRLTAGAYRLVEVALPSKRMVDFAKDMFGVVGQEFYTKLHLDSNCYQSMTSSITKFFTPKTLARLPT